MKFMVPDFLSLFSANGHKQVKGNPQAGTDAFTQQAVAFGQPDRKPWAYLKANFRSVYDAFQTVQNNSPELKPDVITWRDSWRFVYVLSLSPDYTSDKARPVVCELDNGCFIGGPRSMIDVCSPEDAVRSILTQAEFSGHIAAVEKGMGLDGQSQKIIVPGWFPTRAKGGIPSNEMHNLIAG